MRVISGRLGGRQFNAPKGHKTHPMADKIRNALFSVLGDIEGLTFLDVYAGSGAVGFEALSRGAVSVLAIENDVNAARIIGENATSLGVTRNHKITRAGFVSWSEHNPELTFDIVSADPPYDNVQEQNLNLLARHVKQGGIFVLSWPGHLSAPPIPNCNQVQNKTYGDAQLVFYRKV